MMPTSDASGVYVPSAHAPRVNSNAGTADNFRVTSTSAVPTHNFPIQQSSSVPQQQR